MRQMRCGALAGILGFGGCVELNPIFIDPTATGESTGSTTGPVMTSTDSEAGSTEPTMPTMPTSGDTSDTDMMTTMPPG